MNFHDFLSFDSFGISHGDWLRVLSSFVSLAKGATVVSQRVSKSGQFGQKRQKQGFCISIWWLGRLFLTKLSVLSTLFLAIKKCLFWPLFRPKTGFDEDLWGFNVVLPLRKPEKPLNLVFYLKLEKMLNSLGKTWGVQNSGNPWKTLKITENMVNFWHFWLKKPYQTSWKLRFRTKQWISGQNSEFRVKTVTFLTFRVKTVTFLTF